MDKKSEKPRSLFNQFEDELNNELLQHDVSNDRKSSVNGISKTDDVNSTVDHQNTALDESYNNCHIMVKRFYINRFFIFLLTYKSTQWRMSHHWVLILNYNTQNK